MGNEHSKASAGSGGSSRKGVGRDGPAPPVPASAAPMISPAVASHSGTAMRRDIAEEGRDVRVVMGVVAPSACECSPRASSTRTNHLRLCCSRLLCDPVGVAVAMHISERGQRSPIRPTLPTHTYRRTPNSARHCRGGHCCIFIALLMHRLRLDRPLPAVSSLRGAFGQPSKASATPG